MSADKTITLCDCNRTMVLDAKALAHALALRSPITIHTELCRREVGAFNDALQGGDCLVACTQEAPLFAELAEHSGAKAELKFVNIRETRSEEHTSELQSLRHLVCRLLLEK